MSKKPEDAEPAPEIVDPLDELTNGDALASMGYTVWDEQRHLWLISNTAYETLEPEALGRLRQIVEECNEAR